MQCGDPRRWPGRSGRAGRLCEARHGGGVGEAAAGGGGEGDGGEEVAVCSGCGAAGFRASG